MKKIILTVAALIVGTAAFSQSKSDAKLESKPVQDPKKTPVRVVSTKKTSVKKAQPVKKTSTATDKKVVASPPREEKKTK